MQGVDTDLWDLQRIAGLFASGMLAPLPVLCTVPAASLGQRLSCYSMSVQHQAPLVPGSPATTGFLLTILIVSNAPPWISLPGGQALTSFLSRVD